MKVEITEEILEKLNARDPQGYISKLVETHAGEVEKAIKTIIEDPHLSHIFSVKCAMVEEVVKKKIEEIEKKESRRIRGFQDLIIAGFVEKAWARLDPEEREEWVEFVELWGAPFYKDFKLSEIACAGMESTSIASMSRALGLSYSVLTKTIIPRLMAHKIPNARSGKWILERIVDREGKTAFVESYHFAPKGA